MTDVSVRAVLALVYAGLFGWMLTLVGLAGNGWVGLGAGVVALVLACVSQHKIQWPDGSEAKADIPVDDELPDGASITVTKDWRPLAEELRLQNAGDNVDSAQAHIVRFDE